ncbi:MAG: GNAT family N-acetyltransferase [Butyrivibrio sp.]|uniref:GNAT family N-acetyltransferase n=1 Tax=Butyrivibrio sp. TaxID=28121 RepID=UPI0025FAC156|nr:GNAT family N-acetyltransferase [Butyrivibrio sp.]MCR5771397.1 GNAT family N-acetyltransferase [Butyrivibrio sp.]
MFIKRCTLAEIDALQSVCRKTFMETFEEQNTKEDMEKFLEEAYDQEILKKELSDPDSMIYIAFNEENKALGYLKLNVADAQTEKGYDNSLEIQRIYILKEAKGQGVGTEFMKIAENKAIELGFSYIWLGVWEYNFAAQKFYQNKGFKRFSEHIFVLGDDKQTDYLMKKEITH